ncbi:uncharacterized protein BHQ10_000885 [Talaromyces amestolkiae]|uniref:Uncharacterized protein n=1 Tax=Talaromyces amestolkiae TaxID=1196081 RepID=A0A364KMV5_TALAM|nr:uncharacterized protein BHQ10_000885 [Talaromyces amestolkiae]RAO64873.1 hypothetical protein BHQ10_000885 [Talaromyces amestolkiae]
MDQLPMEILDMIISNVQSCDEHHRHSPHTSIIYSDADRLRLKEIGLVNLAFRRSVARVLFQHVIIPIDSQLLFLSRFGDLAGSGFATRVKTIQFDIVTSELLQSWCGDDEEEEEEEDDDDDDDEEEEEEDNSEKAITKISLILEKFPNLQTVVLKFGEAGEADLFRMLIAPLIISLARARLMKMAELRLPDFSRVLEQFVNTNNDGVDQFLLKIQHLHLMESDDRLVDFNILSQGIPDLRCLTVEGQSTYTICPEIQNHFHNLESLEFREMQISARNLLAVIQHCRQTIKYIALHRIILSSASWLHVLHQIKIMSLCLKAFDCHLTTYPMDDNHNKIWTLYGRFLRDQRYIPHALGEIQRQVNVNRLTMGLDPWHATIFQYLDHQPLEVAMGPRLYQELVSQSQRFT